MFQVKPAVGGADLETNSGGFGEREPIFPSPLSTHGDPGKFFGNRIARTCVLTHCILCVPFMRKKYIVSLGVKIKSKIISNIQVRTCLRVDQTVASEASRIFI